jgi:putative ABC transport system ATP-binding protein
VGADVILRLDDIRKTYERPGGPKVALDGISIELHRGQIMGIFGPSGAGKTTLLRIVAGLQTPDSGTITYDGERLDKMSPAERIRYRRREIACIWNTQPLHERLSVVDYVALPLLVDRRDRRSAERRAREALLACEVDTATGTELRELSDGERQRVAIARALVSEPRLLLADGPASALSVTEQEGVMALLASLAHEAKVSVLITDTDAQSLLRADPLFYLCDGKLINGEPLSEMGQVLRFPPARSRRAAANA